MRIEIADAAQNALVRRVALELANEEPRNGRLLWTQTSANVSELTFQSKLRGANVIMHKETLARFLRLERLTHFAPLTFLLPSETPRFAAVRTRHSWASNGQVAKHVPAKGVVQQYIPRVSLNRVAFQVGVYALLSPPNLFLYDDVQIRFDNPYMSAWHASSPLARWMPGCAQSPACALGRAYRGGGPALVLMRNMTGDVLHALSPHAFRRMERLRNFQLFRFDYVVDSQRPWLIDVHSPSIRALHHPEDERLKRALLSDAFRTVVRGRANGRWRCV